MSVAVLTLLSPSLKGGCHQGSFTVPGCCGQDCSLSFLSWHVWQLGGGWERARGRRWPSQGGLTRGTLPPSWRGPWEAIMAMAVAPAAQLRVAIAGLYVSYLTKTANILFQLPLLQVWAGEHPLPCRCTTWQTSTSCSFASTGKGLSAGLGKHYCYGRWTWLCGGIWEVLVSLQYGGGALPLWLLQVQAWLWNTRTSSKMWSRRNMKEKFFFPSF